MAEFLLVHGSGHGAWAWRDVVPGLEALGHRARAIDLPGHGDDRTPLEEITFDGYVSAILASLGARTVLVGHSMAGVPITAAAEAVPERIAALVYVCAYVPRAGQSVADMRRAGPRQPLADAIVMSEDRKSFTFDPAKVREKFYQDCTDADAAFASARLRPQPVLPQATPVGPVARAETLPRHYVVCEKDQAIPPEYQEDMARALDPAHVHRLGTSHSPFFAAPDRLVALLDQIAEAT